MRNLLEYILIHIVTHPDEVLVEESESFGRTQYTIHVHPEDVGRVIGRHGRTIESIRTLGKVRAMKDGVAITIRIADTDQEDQDSTPDVLDDQAPVATE